MTNSWSGRATPRVPPSPEPPGNASGPARCRLVAEGKAVHGLRVLGIDLERAAQIGLKP